MQSRFTLLIGFFFFFNYSLIYSQNADFYWIGNSQQNGGGYWNNVQNWMMDDGNGLDTALRLPGTDSLDIVNVPDSNFNYKGTINIFADTIKVWQFNFVYNDSVDLTVHFDLARISGNDAFIHIDSGITIRSNTLNSTANLILEVPDTNYEGTLEMPDLNFPGGNIIKKGPGTMNLISNINLDTNLIRGGGKLIIENGKLKTNSNHLRLKNIIGNNTTKLYLSESRLEFYNSFDGFNFSMIDTFDAASAKLAFYSTVEMSNEIHLGSHNYDSVEIHTGANLFGGATILNLLLKRGNNYGFSPFGIFDTLEIKNDLKMFGVSNKFTSLHSIKTGDQAEIQFNIQSFSNTLSNLIIRDMKATWSSGAVPVSNSVDMGGNSGWDFVNSPTPKTMYWRPTSNSNVRWNEKSNWTLTPVPGSSQSTRIPLPIDDVVFDPFGLLDPSGMNTIEIDEMVFCKDLNWQGSFPLGASSELHFNKGQLIINGDLHLNSHVEITSIGYSNAVYFVSDSSCNIHSGRKVFNMNITFDGKGQWKLKERLILGDFATLKFYHGDFDSDGYRISAGGIEDNDFYGMGSSNDRAKIDIRHSLIVLKGEDHQFNISRDDTEIQAEGSTIYIKSDNFKFFGKNKAYHKIISRANYNEFHDTLKVMELYVKAASNNVFSTMEIGKHLFITDTNTIQKTHFSPMPIGSSNTQAKIINKSNHEICLDFVHLENVNVSSVDTLIQNKVGINSSCSTACSSLGWGSAQNKCYLYLSGNVADTGGVAIDKGKVILFKLNPNSNAMFDTLSASGLDTSGNFLFTNLYPGKYMLKAEPKKTTGYLPKYYPDKILWFWADTILLNSDSSGFLITLNKPGPPPSFGAKITGKLDTTKKSPTPYLLNLDPFRGPSDVFDSVVIGLINTGTGNISMLDTTDESGYFSFDNVTNGDYAIWPDIAGINVDMTTLNSINVGNTTDSFNLNFEVDSTLMYVNEADSGTSVITYLHETKEMGLKLWPNPVGTQLNLQFSEPISDLKLYDQLMREVRPYWNNNGSFYTIDMNGLRRGIYHLRINGMNVKHRILKL